MEYRPHNYIVVELEASRLMSSNSPHVFDLT